MSKSNLKTLTLVLLAVLIFLGGLGVGRYLYRKPTGEKPVEQTKETEEAQAPLVMYIIDSGETYPEWKKFTNKFGKYSIEYPQEGNVVMFEDGSIVTINITGGGMTMRTLDNRESLSPKEWVEKYYQEAKRRVIKEWEHVVHGSNTYSFATSDPDGERQHSFVSNDQEILVIEFSYLPVPEKTSDKRTKEILFKMFDTFQLLD